MKNNNLICTNCKAGIMCMCKNKEKTKSKIKHPDYYLKDSGYEVIDVINAWKLGFELGNVIKYVARAGKKDPRKEIEDLEKAKEYIDLQIEKQKKILM